MVDQIRNILSTVENSGKISKAYIQEVEVTPGLEGLITDELPLAVFTSEPSECNVDNVVKLLEDKLMS